MNVCFMYVYVCIIVSCMYHNQSCITESVSRLVAYTGIEVNCNDEMGISPLYDAASWGYEGGGCSYADN